jgi:hypothetical protein
MFVAMRRELERYSSSSKLSFVFNAASARAPAPGDRQAAPRAFSASDDASASGVKRVYT